MKCVLYGHESSKNTSTVFSFFLNLIMCKFCAMSGLSNIKTIIILAEIASFIDLVFKHLSHKMESKKVRTQSPSRPCCCLNIPESAVTTRLGTLGEKREKTKTDHCIEKETLKLHFKYSRPRVSHLHCQQGVLLGKTLSLIHI